MLESDVRLKADRIDAFLRPAALRELLQALDHALLLEVDRDRAAGLRHAQALGHAVDGDDLPGAEQHRGADGELAHRTGAPHRHRVLGLDVALHGGLPAGGEDVAEEQRLLVGHAGWNFYRPDIGEWHAHVFRLPAGIAAGEVRVAEQARGAVAEHLVGDLAIAVRPLAHRVVAAAALLAFAADDRKGNHDPVSRFELPAVRPQVRAHLDDFAHEFMAHDVAAHHAGNEAAEEVQVGAADRAVRPFDDAVAWILDLRIVSGAAAE